MINCKSICSLSACMTHQIIYKEATIPSQDPTTSSCSGRQSPCQTLINLYQPFLLLRASHLQLPQVDYVLARNYYFEKSMKSNAAHPSLLLPISASTWCQVGARISPLHPLWSTCYLTCVVMMPFSLRLTDQRLCKWRESNEGGAPAGATLPFSYYPLRIGPVVRS